MTFNFDPRLQGLLDFIEVNLVSTIPGIVRKQPPQETCYAIVLWYHDSSTDDHTPEFGILTQSVRAACDKNNDSPDGRTFCYWVPQQNDIAIDHQLLKRIPDLRSPCDNAYKLMLAANQSDLPLADESEILLPYREMLQRVAKHLSRYDWSEFLDLEESFVITTSDYIGYWWLDDIKAGLSEEQISKLEKRGLLTLSVNDDSE
jgi:hypothetical protein